MVIACLALLVAGIGIVAGDASRAPDGASAFQSSANAARRSSRPPGVPAKTVITVSEGPSGHFFPEGAIGLSVETAQLATTNLSDTHGSLVQLMRALGPSTLRLGGNSLDRSWWAPDHEPAPVWATSVITPKALESLHSLLVATGWRAILGVDLGHFEPSRAASEASVADHILGRSLLAIELGNEPDSYGARTVRLRLPTYSEPDYAQQVATYAGAIHAAAPAVGLYGPDMSSEAWLPNLTAGSQNLFAGITQHFYATFYSRALGNCRGTPAPTVAELLSSGVREREKEVLTLLVAAGIRARRPTRIDETNSTGSCDANGGPLTSPVFASSLWALDWILRAARAGVAGINFHSNFGLCGRETFSPVCALGDVAAFHGEVSPRPEYYGLLAARAIQGGRFVPVSVNEGPSAEPLTAYATRHRNGVLTVAVDSLSASQPLVVLLRAPGYGKATAEALTGASRAARSGVSFGGQTFGPGGFSNSHETRLKRAAGGYTLFMPAAGAAIITLVRGQR